MRIGYGVSRRELGTSRTLDSHACRLRAKLAIDGRRWIVNVWGDRR
jgi:DNA-binding response OmpR family regulator